MKKFTFKISLILSGIWLVKGFIIAVLGLFPSIITIV